MQTLRNPSLWLGLSVLVVALVVIFSVFSKDASDLVRVEKAVESAAKLKVEVNKFDSHQHAEHPPASVNSKLEANAEKIPRHQDMLSEEMKQAIRDKLLFHGPMDVIKHPDGSIELPSNGRFTQMPVAVEMPDGSIKIKEYSSLPE
jgi:hypothetical protein